MEETKQNLQALAHNSPGASLAYFASWLEIKDSSDSEQTDDGGS